MTLDLAATTLELVDISSVSGDEDAILQRVRELMGGGGWRPADDQDGALFYTAATRRPEAPLVLLVGHVDTVPVAGARLPGALEDGHVVGRGATDMKGALAVMLALADDPPDSDLDLGLVFVAREEMPIGSSALLPLLDRNAEARTASLAIVMEPTDNAIEIGCNGNLNARITVRGKAAHSARPWLGDNAIHAAVEALASIADLPARKVEVDGLTYREVISVTRIHGGIAQNVVPDVATAHINFRYAPNRTPEDAEGRVRDLLGHHRVELEVLGNAPPGPVSVKNPLVERLKDAGDLQVGPKQAWTPVAEFGVHGMDAVNFGPGDPGYAHADEERVSISALERSLQVLSGFLSGGWA